MRWFWMVSVVALFYGCGGKERPSQVTNMNTGGKPGSTTSTGGRASTGGALGDAGAAGDTTVDVGGAGGVGGGPAVDSRAPVVEITSPTAVSDPDQGEVLLQDSVTVLCRVSKSTASGSLAVDPSTVKIAILDGSGTPEAGGTATGNAGEYSATFVVSNVANGPVGFRCRASDIGATPRTSSTEISTFVDRGPTITVTSPIVNDILPLKTAVAFEFMVEPAPLAAGDRGAAVGEVTLSVRGVSVADLAPAPRRPGVYIAPVDFADPILFPETPSGDIPVVITAANSRSPKAAVRTKPYSFKLDGEGPVINITFPVANTIVGPKDQLLSFTVTDAPSGVNKSKVAVTLNNGKPLFFAPPPSAWTESNGKFTFKFDSTKLVGSIAEATINVHAVDNVGNESDGESLVIKLDDYAPIVSLNPGNVRVVYPSTTAAKAKCSAAFDPLGKAVGDLDTVQAAAVFRVLAWDLTNHASGAIADYPSLVEKMSVRLYFQPDPEQALLVDTDGDGMCDFVNPQAEDGSNLVLMNMGPVAFQGTVPNKGIDLLQPDDRATAVPVVGDTCDLTTTNPVALCSAHHSDLTHVIKYTLHGQTEPVVYARDPMANDPETCTGNSWEVRPLALQPGWICMAAVADDVAKNTGISAPLRVCIDDNDDPKDPSPCLGVEPPTCTDTCTPPPEFPSRLLEY